MNGRRSLEPGGRAVALLATCIVVTLGLGTCLAVSLSVTGNPNGTWICIVCFLAIALVLWGMFESADRPVGDRTLLFFWRAKKKPDDYIVVRRRELSPEEFPEGGQRPQPPSLESVRRIREEHATKTWVPSPTAPPRDPRGE